MSPIVRRRSHAPNRGYPYNRAQPRFPNPAHPYPSSRSLHFSVDKIIASHEDGRIRRTIYNGAGVPAAAQSTLASGAKRKPVIQVRPHSSASWPNAERGELEPNLQTARTR